MGAFPQLRASQTARTFRFRASPGHDARFGNRRCARQHHRGPHAGGAGTRRGRIRDYLPHPYHRDCRGYPTDDSQLTFWTLEQVLADGRLIPERLGRSSARAESLGSGNGRPGDPAISCRYPGPAVWRKVGRQRGADAHRAGSHSASAGTVAGGVDRCNSRDSGHSCRFRRHRKQRGVYRAAVEPARRAAAAGI